MFALVRNAVMFVSLAGNVFGAMPSPWTRELYLTSPAMTGNDVIIAQNLMLRSPSVTAFEPNGVFEESSKLATTQFQEANNLAATGIFDELTAALLLDLHSADGIVFYAEIPFTCLLFRCEGHWIYCSFHGISL
jgi:hypothetical protein